MKNALSWVKRTSSPSVSEPRFFHAFPKVILGFDTQVATSGKPLAIVGASVGTRDGPWDIKYSAGRKQETGFLITVLSVFTTDNLILLTLNPIVIKYSGIRPYKIETQYT